MSSEWNGIEKVFKKALGSNQGGEPLYQWADFEKRVIRSNFLRFNPASFNAYYLTLVFVFVSLLGFSSYKAINYNREIKKKDTIIRQYQRKELEIKIKAYLIDSIKAIKTSKIIIIPNIQNEKNNTPDIALNKKSNSNNPPDTITRITFKKKVIKKQLIIKKTGQVKDTVVIQ
jgi:hypothetical protein